MLAARFPILLAALLGAPLLGHAQGVTFNVCNGGKVAIDAYLVQQSSVSAKHIAPAGCGDVAYVDGPMAPGIIAFGFADSKGQWRGARRTDVVPDFNSFLDRSIGFPTILERTKQTVTVKQGGTSATIPGLLAFRPQAPWCDAPTQSQSYTSSLPLNATRGQIIQAKGMDMTSSPSTPGGSSCHGQYYNLTVIPYPETSEVSLDSQCDPCIAKEEAGMTPQEKAANDRAMDDGIAFLATLPGFNSTALGKTVVTLAAGEADRRRDEAARRAEIAKGPYNMNWKDLASFITSAFGVRGRPPLMANRHILLRGTVSRVQLPGAQSSWVQVFFKETPTMDPPVDRLPGDYFIKPYTGTDNAFNICADDPTVLSDVFGANYSTTLIGKTIEVEGEVNRGACSTAAGIHMFLARQVKSVTPGMAASGQKWTAVLQPVAAPAITAVPVSPGPPPIAPATPAATRNGRTANAAPVPTASAAPAAATAPPRPAAPPVAAAPNAPPPTPPAAPATDPLVGVVLSYLKAKLPEAQILQSLRQQNHAVKLTGADRAQLEDAGASEKLIEGLANPQSIPPSDGEQRTAQRRVEQENAAAVREQSVACQTKVAKEYPTDRTARARALAECMQGK
jgi:hypothetical protein